MYNDLNMGSGKGKNNRRSMTFDSSNEASTLLSRDEFRIAVFSRDNSICVACGRKAVDAHHLIERRLWSDGGYYIENGISLCEKCHLQAEQTVLSVENLREKTGITQSILPPQFDVNSRIDKWGNEILSNGQRLRGELFDDESVQKVLRQGGVLDLFTNYVKYPRTVHLPFSLGLTPNDLQLQDTKHFEGKQVVITEKLDGECTSLYHDYVHARSIDSKHHESRTWVKSLQAQIGHEIPGEYRLCGENVFAQHSIAYDKLPAYFLLYSVWNEKNECISWEETKEWAELLGLETVPVLYEGPWDEEKVYACYPQPQYSKESEGFVVRNADGFSYSSFKENVAKFVRADHVEKHNKHWMHEKVRPNKLA